MTLKISKAKKIAYLGCALLLIIVYVGCSQPSTTTQTQIQPSKEPPQNLIATTLTYSSIKLTWNPFIDEPNKMYSLYRSASINGQYNSVYTGKNNTFTDTKLTGSTTYFYKVKTAESDYSEVASATTSAPPPSAPAGFTFTGKTYNSMDLKWNTVANADSYKLYRSNNSYLTDPVLIGTYTTNTAQITDIPTKNNYYWLIAENSIGESGKSATLQIFSPGTQNNGSLPAKGSLEEWAKDYPYVTQIYVNPYFQSTWSWYTKTLTNSYPNNFFYFYFYAEGGKTHYISWADKYEGSSSFPAGNYAEIGVSLQPAQPSMSGAYTYAFYNHGYGYNTSRTFVPIISGWYILEVTAFVGTQNTTGKFYIAVAKKS